jgi:endonuclease YncB( thermonuclease family)
MRRAALALALGLATAAAAPSFAPGGAVTLARVVDGNTVALADGRTVRLAGIDGLAGKAALEKLLAGKTLELRFAETRSDRDGRTVAELYAGGNWVERTLVARGLARVHGTADNRIGLADLLATEAMARRAQRGLWRQRRYRVRDADSAAADAGTWQIVEGTVAHVAMTGGGAYVDFGAAGSGALALHLDRAALALCRQAGLDLRALMDSPVRVRGFIDGTKSPTIDIAFPEEIEVLQAGAKDPPPLRAAR